MCIWRHMSVEFHVSQLSVTPICTGSYYVEKQGFERPGKYRLLGTYIKEEWKKTRGRKENIAFPFVSQVASQFEHKHPGL